ncbi:MULTISPECIES: ribonuclease H [unclassified Ensifer]|uniref:ribonuclease H family protein n=1 Tax=unclassified Ensifer TaxID=2633371 RepID=UPI00070F7B42|nr:MULTISPECIES: ribonuclease H [unclassified Ensifer]KQW62713.1 ribonuclease HI [Ensifer sp. Root1252]KRC83533.1 ribonuclease HI [Ensifer sp. Root231]KRC86562.1 ribonuclease HI [Ensifer sp. Root258]
MAKWQKFKKARSSGKRSYEIDHSAFAAGLHVFADGACEPNPGPGGWGVAAFRDGVEIASDHGGEADTTNNRMELTGLLKGIAAAKALDGPVTIWCDSMYCVKGTNEWRHGWKKNSWQRGGPNADPRNRILLNAELWQAIDEALLGAAQITVRWCKGHAGIAGNERADELSNMGMALACERAAPENEPVDYLTAEYRQRLA